jgi:hypothetical protein
MYILSKNIYFYGTHICKISNILTFHWNIYIILIFYIRKQYKYNSIPQTSMPQQPTINNTLLMHLSKFNKHLNI